MHDQAITYLRQGIETFIAMNGRIVSDELSSTSSEFLFDSRNGKLPVEVHGHSFREYQPVIMYDARLPEDAVRVEIARHLILFAPEHWSLVGRQFGNASERGKMFDSYARSVAENGGRKHLDALLKQHVFEK